MNIWTILHYLFFIIAVSSIALVAVTWLGGAIAIWYPRTGEGSRFWNCFDKLVLTLQYVSASENKLSRTKFLLNQFQERSLPNDNENS
jgi:hypothetical protein